MKKKKKLSPEERQRRKELAVNKPKVLPSGPSKPSLYYNPYGGRFKHAPGIQKAVSEIKERIKVLKQKADSMTITLEEFEELRILTRN